MTDNNFSLNQSINFTGASATTGDQGPYIGLNGVEVSYEHTGGPLQIEFFDFNFSYPSGPSTMGLDLLLQIDGVDQYPFQRFIPDTRFDPTVRRFVWVSSSLLPGRYQLSFSVRAVLFGGPPIVVQILGDAILRLTAQSRLLNISLQGIQSVDAGSSFTTTVFIDEPEGADITVNLSSRNGFVSLQPLSTTIPAGDGDSGRITISGMIGGSDFVTATADGYQPVTFTVLVRPVLSSLSPSSGPRDTMVTLLGDGFAPGASVSLGHSTERTATFGGSRTLSTLMPAFPLGPVSVGVEVNGQYSQELVFQITQANCQSQTYSGRQDTNISWMNWVGQISGPVNTFFEPNSLLDLVNIIARASREGRRLRVVGSGWAFEDIAYSPDWMVSLVRMNRRLTNVTGSALNSNWSNRNAAVGDEVLFHIEAGATVADVNESLADVGLGLPTLGGANGQAIAGVISTSTHGGDIFLPPFPDLVMAMHVVTGDGREIWIERATQPITEDRLLARVFACQEAEILRNDDLFNALLVGFGRFGVIYSYVIRVRPAFRLAEWTVKQQSSVVTTALRMGISSGTFLSPLLDALPPPPFTDRLDISNPRGLEIVFDSQNLGECFVKRRWVTDETDDMHLVNTQNPLCAMGPGGVLAAGLAALTVLEGTPPWVLIPFFPVAVEAKKAELSSNLAQNNRMTAGEMLALVITAFWDLGAGLFIPGLTNTQFDLAYADSIGDGKRGRSDLIVSGFREQSLQTCYRANSIEPIFDAHSTGYIDFLDEIIAAAPNSRQAGYFSLRWSATSRATLSMHNFPSSNAVAIEVTSLKGLPDNQNWMSAVENMALSHGGRPHWGQENHLNADQVSSMFGDSLVNWRASLTALVGGADTFSSAHTTQRGLEPLDSQGNPTLFGQRVGDLI